MPQNNAPTLAAPEALLLVLPPADAPQRRPGARFWMERERVQLGRPPRRPTA